MNFDATSAALAPAATTASIPALVAPSTGRPAVSVLMYHQVGPFANRPAHKAAFCDIARFEAHMAWLRALRYHVIGLEDAWRGLFAGAPLPRRAVVLTFDDGYENFERWAWPVLQRNNFPATLFAVAGQLGHHAGWLDRSFDPAPLLDAAALRRLADEGVSIGSHSMSHARLTTLPDAQARHELRGSKALLEDALGRAVPDFCYPYGDHDERVRDLTRAAGYRLALTCARGAANTANNAWEIPRKGISWGDNVLGLAWKLHAKNARKGGLAPASSAKPVLA
ncbi:polysaccharide deacetylase family protein [soil metagenome]